MDPDNPKNLNQADLEAELAKIDRAITEQEKLRGSVSDALLQAMLDELQAKRIAIQAQLTGSGAIAQGPGARAAGEGSVLVDGSVGGSVVIAREGAQVFIGEQPVHMPAVDRASALGRYLQHIISRNRYLQLQGIRSGGKLVHIELDQIYVTLRATRQRVVQAEEAWLTEEATLAPGERRRMGQEARTTLETVTVSVNEALVAHSRLAVLGDPGSGKTTLLRYLALLYARDLAEETDIVQTRLGLEESGRLPILLPLRQIGSYLRTQRDDGTEGHALLLDFLLRHLKNDRVDLPADFFDEWLSNGKAVILLDGLDEVADPDLRRRVSRLVEAFTCAYHRDCRYLVTSRIVGYTGPARLGEEYATTTVRDFTLEDVRLFLTHWHRLIAIGQMGLSESAESYAADQTRQLLQAIEANERIRELAINPLLLTVIALVHRDRVRLPDRRAELYAEAIDVLLGKWEEAKGVVEVPILGKDRPFDTGDKRLMLQNLALYMHEQQQKEISADELRRWLGERFYETVGNWREVAWVVNRFLHVIEERTGILSARGEGVYSFSHLTFQEYLAAVAAAERDDYVVYTLSRTADPWWREVILLEAGYLSTKSREKTTRLIQAILDLKAEPVPYHNLVLAADCLRDVGSNRIQGDLQGEVQQRLRKGLETTPPVFGRWLKRFGSRGWLEQRSAAMEALVRAGAGYWGQPYCEPEWIEIPAGEFWMGSERGSGDEKPAHQVYLDRFLIVRVPVTNAQYQLFVQITGHKAPGYWEGRRPPKGKESHPAVNVTWVDATTYCAWLGQVTGKSVTLPSEAQWEKAARGSKDKREYPWGDTFDANRCNSGELVLGDTTPVGIFPNGASPYGCLDMSGNVWEWTRSLYKAYPYEVEDGREELKAAGPRVLRGGSFFDDQYYARCAFRFDSYFSGYPGGSRGRGDIGFRVVVSPI